MKEKEPKWKTKEDMDGNNRKLYEGRKCVCVRDVNYRDEWRYRTRAAYTQTVGGKANNKQEEKILSSEYPYTSIDGERGEVVQSLGRSDVVVGSDFQLVTGGRLEPGDGVHALGRGHRLTVVVARRPRGGGRRRPFPLDRVVQYVASAAAPQVEPHAGRRTVVRDRLGRRFGRHGHYTTA